MSMISFMWAITKHFIIIGVRATGRKSFMYVTTFGNGVIVDVSKHPGSTAWESEVLKMSVSTPASS